VISTDDGGMVVAFSGGWIFLDGRLVIVAGLDNGRLESAAALQWPHKTRSCIRSRAIRKDRAPSSRKQEYIGEGAEAQRNHVPGYTPRSLSRLSERTIIWRSDISASSAPLRPPKNILSYRPHTPQIILVNP
jgi:hypothetical protein